MWSAAGPSLLDACADRAFCVGLGSGPAATTWGDCRASACGCVLGCGLARGRCRSRAALTGPLPKSGSGRGLRSPFRSPDRIVERAAAALWSAT